MMNTKRRKIEKQKGIVSVFMAISLLVIVVVAGLGMDLGHAYVNKTKLQTIVDALALEGAKSIDDGFSTAETEVKIDQLFLDNIGLSGNGTLNSLNTGNIDVEFSSKYENFAHDGLGPYVRVSLNDLVLNTWLVRASGIKTLRVNASALAGPSVGGAEACGLAPLIPCGDPSQNPADDPDNFWGYKIGDATVLKTPATQGNTLRCIGPGNFQLASVGNSNSANEIAKALAGGESFCLGTGDTTEVNTAPGSKVGPVSDGINALFDIYGGGHGLNRTDFPPDNKTTAVSDSITHTVDSNGCVDSVQVGGGTSTAGITGAMEWYDTAAPENTYGVPGKRILRVPIADCSGRNSGESNLPLLALGCFLVLQPTGHSGHDSIIYGQFVGECATDVDIGIEHVENSSAFKIILLDDLFRQDA